MLPPVEGQPWRATCAMVATVQLFYMVLDLAVNKGVDISWNNAVVTIEFVSAVSLAAFEAVRIVAFLRSEAVRADRAARTSAPSPEVPPPSSTGDHASSRRNDNHLRTSMWLLWTSLLFQVVIAIFAACSFRLDSPPVEWAMYAVALAWSIVHAGSRSAVAATCAPAPDLGARESHIVGSVADIFRSTFSLHIWPREKCRPWIYGSAVLALSHAALVGLQGIMIDWLMELSFEMYSLPSASELAAGNTSSLFVGCATQQEVGVVDDPASCESRLSMYAYGLVAVWFAATASRVMDKVVNASLRLSTELWLRDRAFAVRQELVASSNDVEPGGHPEISSLHAVYDVDIERVLKMHRNLQEIIVNGLLVVSNYAALLYLNTKVGILSLSVGALWATLLGPPLRLPKSDSAPVEESTSSLIKGSTLLNESPSTANDGNLRQRHRKQVLIPLEARWLRRTVYSDAAIDVYVAVFATFLTITIIICIAWEVAEGRMSPNRVLAVLFVFVQLLRASTTLPALNREVLASSSSLTNVNRVLRLQQERVRKLRVLKEQETHAESAEEAIEQPIQVVPVSASTAAVPRTSS